MKIATAITATILGIAVAGCTVIEQKAEDYQEVAAKFSRPDKIRVCYTREEETRQGFETRCFGNDCELPECP